MRQPNKCYYFKIEELVHPDFVYSLGEELCWELIPDVVKLFLDTTRYEYGYGITINDYLWGGSKVDSGVRRFSDNKYASKSKHKEWTTFDLKDSDGNIERLQAFIKENAERLNIERIENFSHTPTWVHAEYAVGGLIKKTYWFNP